MNNVKDAQYIQDAADAVQQHIPDGHGFILMVMPYGEDGTLRYTATLDRRDAINVLKEFMLKVGATEDWMKHIS